MIIQELFGDVTSPLRGIIGHGVNCQGVMGSGVALAIRNKFPEAYHRYVELCNNTKPEWLLGTTQLVQVSENLYIANMFTQLNYGGDGKQYAELHAVRDSVDSLRTQREITIHQRLSELNVVCYKTVKSLIDYHTGRKIPVTGNRSLDLIESIGLAVSAAIGDHYPDVDIHFSELNSGCIKDIRYDLPIYLPLIGCGLGGLDWEQVKPIIDVNSGKSPVVIYHYSK